jgi:hypothetical protein
VSLRNNKLVVFLRSNKILLFLVTAIVLVIFVAVVWTYISPAYNRVLVNLGNKIAPSGVTLELEERNIYFYHHAPEGTSTAWIFSWALHFGLVLVIALIGATPGLRLKQRLKFIALAFALLFVIHVAAIWVMARLMASGVVTDKNPLFNLLVTVGCDLFPVVIWGVLSLKYWFPQGLARETELPGRGSHRKKIKRSR